MPSTTTVNLKLDPQQFDTLRDALNTAHGVHADMLVRSGAEPTGSESVAVRRIHAREVMDLQSVAETVGADLDPLSAEARRLVTQYVR